MAATLALRASLLHTSKRKIAAVASANKLSDFTNQLQKRIKQGWNKQKPGASTSQPKIGPKPNS